MYRIAKRFEFSASHQLTHLPDGHQCARLHGHNYVVEVELQADALNADAFVLDYGEMRPFKEFIDAQLDHRHLNDFMIKPTAELLASWLYEKARAMFGATVAAVRVMETPKTVAEYRR